MTPWISARRADAFESRLNSPTRGDQHPSDVDAELADLVAQMRALASPAPRPEFLGSLRERLMTEAAEVLVAVPAPERAALDRANARLVLPERNPRRQRRLVAAVGTVVLLGTGSTMAVAAQSALPGDGLYPIKRLVESARSTITFSDTGKGEQALDHARARLTEAAQLIENGSDASLYQVPGTLTTFTSQAHEGADALLGAYAADGSTDSVQQVRDFVADSLARLAAVQPTAPESVQTSLRDAAEALVGIDANAVALCPGCGKALADYSNLLSAPAVDPTEVLEPGADPTPGTGAPTGLPTIDPQAVASANGPGATATPSGQGSTAPTLPTQQPGGQNTPGQGTTQGSGVQPSTAPSTTATQPSAAPTPTPSAVATTKPPLQGLTDALLGDGKSGDDATTGVVPGVVGGLLGVVGGLLGGGSSSTSGS